MRLMTNNPAKFIGLKGYGLAVIGRVPVLSPITEENKRYLETKRTKMGHVYGSDLPGNLRRFLNPDAETGDASEQWKGNGNLSEDWFGTYSLFYFIFQLIIIIIFFFSFFGLSLAMLIRLLTYRNKYGAPQRQVLTHDVLLFYLNVEMRTNGFKG